MSEQQNEQSENLPQILMTTLQSELVQEHKKAMYEFKRLVEYNTPTLEEAKHAFEKVASAYNKLMALNTLLVSPPTVNENKEGEE